MARRGERQRTSGPQVLRRLNLPKTAAIGTFMPLMRPTGHEIKQESKRELIAILS